MNVAHIGPPLARMGGPAGYLLQLRTAAVRAGACDGVTFPDLAPRLSPGDRSVGPTPLRRALSRLKHAFVPPRYYRPSEEALRAERGQVEGMMASARVALLRESEASFERALADSADVLFCHDSTVAEHALDCRRAGQRVWLMQHAPFTTSLYLAWCWGAPERDWREVMTFPDVARWSQWEAAVWNSVDRLIVPCPEAFEELIRVELGAAPLASAVTCVLSGAEAARTEPRDRVTLRRQWQLPPHAPIGLFVGNGQPYRGLDALITAASALSRSDPAGLVAVAGPPMSSIPRSARIRALGPVANVGALLDAVDFVVNVNRFSLLDLSTIEAIEAGKPLLLHAVGGNKCFARLGAGCEMLADLDPQTIGDGLRRMFSASEQARAEMARASRACYEAHFTLAAFWHRHAALYAE